MVYPVRPVNLPSALTGQENGKLDPGILRETPGRAGGPLVLLVEPAARAWRAMCASALKAGVLLQSTSLVDSYRPYTVQFSVFHQRYTTQRNTDWETKVCGGTTYYKYPIVASAACPGTSNHGWGLAVDVSGAAGKRLDWLLANAWYFGFSWELQAEPWHIRYCTGDAIPAAVLAYEKENEDMPDILYQIQSADPKYNGSFYLSNRVERRGPLRTRGGIFGPATEGTAKVVLRDIDRGADSWEVYLDAVAGPLRVEEGDVELSDAQLDTLADKVASRLQALVFKAQ